MLIKVNHCTTFLELLGFCNANLPLQLNFESHSFLTARPQLDLNVMSMNKYRSKDRTSVQSITLFFSYFVTQESVPVCMENILSICVYSWKLNRTKAADIWVYLLEQSLVLVKCLLEIH